MGVIHHVERVYWGTLCTCALHYCAVVLRSGIDQRVVVAAVDVPGVLALARALALHRLAWPRPPSFTVLLSPAPPSLYFSSLHKFPLSIVLAIVSFTSVSANLIVMVVVLARWLSVTFPLLNQDF
jgi:hypothetical protein